MMVHKYLKENIQMEKNGEGKEDDIIGRLIFEGEYLNGKRNGKGKEYYDLEELYLLKKLNINY